MGSSDQSFEHGPNTSGIQAKTAVENFQPTPHADVNAIIRELFSSITAVLGSQIVGVYLDGSLASGDFDQDSDIDFVVITKEPINAEEFAELQAMHDRIALLDSVWAIQLEGFYISKQAVRRFDPAQPDYPNIERGPGERLKLVPHELTWNIHRHILRERGITLLGPAPETLIDPITANDLRQTMSVILRGWAADILNHLEWIQPRGYQSYVVLSICRILYTLEHGDVVSKKAALAWAYGHLEHQWTDLLQRAWVGRHHSDQQAGPQDISGTLDLIRYALAKISD